MVPYLKFFLSQLSHRIVNLYLKSCNFCLYFILFVHVWIPIRILNTDPDPQHWLNYRNDNTQVTVSNF